MSLSLRLIIAISSLAIITFIGTLSINMVTTRSYLNQQLADKSQNASTAIAKTIATDLAEKNVENITITVNALYDSGSYTRIQVQDVSGNVLAVRKQTVISVKDVPDWFINFIPLKDTAGIQQIISSDFVQLGRIVVNPHPGLAYQELWDTFTRNTWWLLSVAVISLLAFMILIRQLLKPITTLRKQAEQIANGDFTIHDTLPSLPELKKVGETMNRMSAKVASMLAAQTELTERMRKRAYQDVLTGLNNRRYFAEQMDHLLKTPEEFISGALMLIEISSFKEYNQQHGYVKADDLLRKTAEILSNICASIQGVCLARVSGASFSFLAPNTTLKEIKEYANKLQSQFESLHDKGSIDNVASIHMGITCYDGSQDGTELLSMCDMALRASQVKGPNCWHIYDEQNLKQERIRSATAWRKIIKQMLKEKKLELHFQPVRNFKDYSILHYEVLARLPDIDGNLVSAGTFLPMAQRHGMAVGVDIVVIEKLLAMMGDENQVQYAVNLCRSSLQDTAFIDWLEKTLGKYPDRAPSIIFESQEFSVTSHLDDIHLNIERIRDLGCAFSLDHFGTSSPDFGYLLNTKIDYIKIDGSYIHGIHHHEDNRFFIKSITEIAHGLDIKVIGEYVESESEWKTLQSLNLDGAQGHYVGKPFPDVAPDKVFHKTVNHSS